MMNKKGFTLVELIATIVILGVVMTIAVPNVLGIIEKNKSEEFIEVAKMFITEVEYEVRRNDSIELPSNYNHAILMSADYIGLDKFGDDPYGFTFDATSHVLLVKEYINGSVQYNYYVWLTASNLVVSSCSPTEVQTISSKSRGIKYATLDNLNNDDRNSAVEKINIEALKLYNVGDKIKINNKDIIVDAIYYWK